MQRTNVGPRGWAILILMGGAFFASAFSRKGPLSTDTAPPKSPHLVANNSDEQSAEIAREQLSAQIAAQLVANELPATPSDPGAQVRSLPQWAKPASELDQLIRQGPPTASSSPAFGSLAPLETWRDTQPTPQASDPNQLSDLAYRESPWEISAEAAPNASGTSKQYAGIATEARIPEWPSRDPARNWDPTPGHQSPEAGLGASSTSRLSPSANSIGSLVGSARRDPLRNPISPKEPSQNHQQLPAAKPQAQRRFVYQPGYIGGD